MTSTSLSQILLLPILLLLSSTLIPHVHATANDWNQPCLSGVCHYDLPNTKPDGSSGTLKIWGAIHAIADITPAADWEILSCDPNSLSQEVRIVCKNPDSPGCAHLFAKPPSTGGGGTSQPPVRRANSTGTLSSTSSSSTSSSVAAPEPSGSGTAAEGGAVGKIVRLPENCGKSAFARVKHAYVPKDQSVPPHIAKRLVRRDGQAPGVKTVHLDVDFGGDGDPRYGNVAFAIVGANVPGAAAQGNLDTSSLDGNDKTRRSRIYQQRGFTDFIGDTIHKISGLNDFDVDKSTTLQPFDIDKSFNILNQQIECSAPVGVKGAENATVGVNGKLSVDVDAKVHAVVSLGVVASGTVIPPKIDKFGITSGMTADLDGEIVMTAGVGGTLDSGKIKIFELGVPGLDFPGVLSVGPTFEVNAEAKATLDLDIDLTIGVSYTIDKAEFTFPTGGTNGGTFTPGDTPLKLSVQPSGTATGTVEAHLIPSLNLGIEAFGGTVGAKVFLDLDASAKATIGVGATGNPITITPRSVDPAPIEVIGHRAAAVGQIRGRGLVGDSYFNGKRSPFGFGSIVDGIKGAAKKVGGAVKGAAKKVGGAVKGAAKKVGGAVKSAAKKVGGAAKDVVHKVTGKPKPKPKEEPAPKPKPKPKPKPTKTTSAKPAESTKAKVDAVVRGDDGDDKPPKGAGFGGCIEIDAGLDVSVGADADFLGLFDPSTKISLFSKEFQLFKKCFGDESQVRRRQTLAVPRTIESRELKCNDEEAGKPEELANETVLASSIV